MLTIYHQKLSVLQNITTRCHFDPIKGCLQLGCCTWGPKGGNSVLFFSDILTLICINLNNEPNSCLYFICIYCYCLLLAFYYLKCNVCCFSMQAILDRHCYLPSLSIPPGRSTQNNTTLPYFSCLDILLSSS
jgi:hypothetical protein